MCDTLVALGNETKDGAVIFAKNSDREPNEAHELVCVPSADHPENSTVRCTYIQIPQVAHTNAVLLAKPFWIWGAEMGTNEHGVTIGNEAVFTKIPVSKEPGLIGMDFLRLALERAATALDALKVITRLLETHGQGGNCGHREKLYYHNSFLIADPNEAWVLETADRHWAAEKVQGIRTISNRITIGNTYDMASEHLVDYAVEQGWCKSRADFDFGRCYSDFLYTTFGDSYARFCRSRDLLKAESGKVNIGTMMKALRDHGLDNDADFHPGQGITGADVCMHASFGPIRVGQSTGSMISVLKPGYHTHWLSGTAAPCTGIFKPVWLDTGLPDQGQSPGESFDEASLWWQHEQLHRLVLKDYRNRLNAYGPERDEMESSFIAAVEALGPTDIVDRRALTASCFEEARRATARWTEKVRTMDIVNPAPFLHKIAWREFNRETKVAL